MLLVGKDKTPLLEHLPDEFLLLADKKFISALPNFRRKKVTYFDHTKHSFNVVKNLTYPKPEQWLEILYAARHAGENTLTRELSEPVLLSCLTSNPTRLDRLISPPTSRSDPYQKYAYAKIQRMLLSPVLKRVFCKPTNFSFDGIIIADLDDVSRYDRFLIGNFLALNYEGIVIIPDFARYSCLFYKDLIYQNRLIAGVNYLSESELKDDLLLIDEKVGSRCLYEDAKVLAEYAGLMPDPTREDNDYNRFIKDAIR